MADIIRKLFPSASTEGGQGTEIWIEPNAIDTGKVLGYFGRINDRAQVKNAIVKRFGTGIRRTKDSSGNTLESYVKEGFDARMSAGHIEVVGVGLGHTITSALATLFTEPGQRFSIVGVDGEETPSEVSDWLSDFRTASQFINGLTQADEEAVQLGCSVLLVEFFEGHLKYRTIDPGKVKVRFDGAVESDGETRPVNYQDIEDATCVIIETGTIDAETRSYVAIFGRSYTYPNGRYVSYMSDSDGKDVPDVGTDGVYEWTTAGGEIANPLSLYANDHPDLDLPEYPVVLFYGGHVRMDRLFPISTSLLEESIEADVAASHIRATSSDNARGTLVVKKSRENPTAKLPTHLRGEVSLEHGVEIESITTDSAASTVAWELLKAENIASAQSYGVPDYYVSSEDHTVEASSGVALKIRTGPLIKFRGKRAAINAPSVAKLFEVEKALIAMFVQGDDAIIRRLESAGQQWDPGEKDLPEELADTIEAADKLYDRGIYDDIEYIRVVYKLPSEAEAIDKYEELKRRREEYPPLKEETSDVGQFGSVEMPSGAGGDVQDQAPPERDGT